MSAIGGPLPHPSDTAALSAIGSGDSAGPYVASFGRLGASGYSVADGFVVRPAGGHHDDPVDLDGVGREQLGAQLAALELRCGRRLGDPDRPLRLTVLALPRSLEVPIDHGPSGRIAAAPQLGVRDLADVAALHRTIREQFTRFPRHAIAVLAQPDERSVTFTGTLVTRHPAHGMIATHGVWPGGTFGSIGRVPSHALQTDCDAIAAAAEAACTDMCTVSIAITDDTPRVMAVHPAVRSPVAALRVAVDLRDNGLITKAEALRRVPLSLFVPESTAHGRTAATTDVSRLLEWADHEAQVPVIDPATCGLPVVRSATDVAALADGADTVLIEPTGNPAAVGEQLWAIADAVDARGIDVAVLALTDSLRRATTTTLPPLPWRAVAGETRDPAARVLAARLGAGATVDDEGPQLG